MVVAVGLSFLLFYASGQVMARAPPGEWRMSREGSMLVGRRHAAAYAVHARDGRRLLECLGQSCRLELPCRKQIGRHQEARVFPSDGSWFAHAGL